jgi:PIN domain nuclease of toxin-antitoxin system
VSTASLWELAAKASTGRLPEFAAIMNRGPDSLRAALSESGFRLLPAELHHVTALYRLPPHHADPFDRMMIAQAMLEDLTIITHDRSFQYYSGLKLLMA